MRTLMGLVVAAGLLLGSASVSRAQFPIGVGSPYIGQGYGSNLGGYGGGYGSGSNSYQGGGFLSGPGVIGGRNIGFGGYPAPSNGGYGAISYVYSSGYAGQIRPAYGTGPAAYPAFRYSPGYGYDKHQFNSIEGYRPFRPNGRPFR